MHYPEMNPIALSLGPIHIHWYGVMYALSMIAAWALGKYRAKRGFAPVKPEDVSDLIFFWGILGVVTGGRLGYVLFYQFSALWHDPIYALRIWDGGMSFHGGLLGVLLSMLIYAKRHHISYIALMDFLAPLVPTGIFLGRIGNFINGELWGRVTTMPWGMIFPQAGPEPRHPTQLYEALGEGVLFFILLWWYSSVPRERGQVSGFFLLVYAIIRFSLEFFRQPDAHLGFVLFGVLTQGQLLCIPMFLLGLYMLRGIRANNPLFNL